MGDVRPGQTIAVAVVFLCVGAALLVPRLAGTPESRREAEVRAAVKVVNHALWKYAQSHGGEYPRTAAVAGGDGGDDALLKEGYLVRYPQNPFGGRRNAVRNVVGKGFSAGDFVYMREAESKYEYILFGWGAAEGRKVMKIGGGEH
ncbi:MAG: hypothetical protein ABIH66_10700 [bacterium]